MRLLSASSKVGASEARSAVESISLLYTSFSRCSSRASSLVDFSLSMILMVNSESRTRRLICSSLRDPGFVSITQKHPLASPCPVTMGVAA